MQPGTPISFVDRLTLVADGTVSAQLDNVVSVALILHLFRNGFQGTALFTAQEEAGRSWRYALNWFKAQGLATERLVVLDTSPFPTPEEVAEIGLVLRRKDASAPFADATTDEVASRCADAGAAVVFKDAWVEKRNVGKEKPASLGRTELGRLIAASEGTISGTTLQIPTTGYHTAEETTTAASLEAALKVLGAMA